MVFLWLCLWSLWVAAGSPWLSIAIHREIFIKYLATYKRCRKRNRHLMKPSLSKLPPDMHDLVM